MHCRRREREDREKQEVENGVIDHEVRDEEGGRKGWDAILIQHS